jgi:hypothetical protein
LLGNHILNRWDVPQRSHRRFDLADVEERYQRIGGSMLMRFGYFSKKGLEVVGIDVFVGRKFEGSELFGGFVDGFALGNGGARGVGHGYIF